MTVTDTSTLDAQIQRARTALNLRRDQPRHYVDRLETGLAQLVAQRDGIEPPPRNAQVVLRTPYKSDAERAARHHTPATVQWDGEQWVTYHLQPAAEAAIALLRDYCNPFPSSFAMQEWHARRDALLDRVGA